MEEGAKAVVKRVRTDRREVQGKVLEYALQYLLLDCNREFSGLRYTVLGEERIHASFDLLRGDWGTTGKRVQLRHGSLQSLW
jgi:hypothetical protein